jgi:hypothetical protein
MPVSATPLATYLNDHLAGSVAALELIDGLLAHPAEPGDREFLAGLRQEIEQDQDVLRALLRELGAGESPVRKAAGWFAEKLADMKLKWDDRESGGFRHFEALEGLALGLRGKLALWEALASVAPAVPVLQRLDLASLARRADTQHAAVETRRKLAAAAVFG